jgi:hypothetical protein
MALLTYKIQLNSDRPILSHYIAERVARRAIEKRQCDLGLKTRQTDVQKSPINYLLPDIPAMTDSEKVAV